MKSEYEHLDPEQAKARDRVMAWFKNSDTARPSADELSPSTGSVATPDADRTKTVGLIVCLVYAVVWLSGWTSESWWTSDTASIFNMDRRPIPGVLSSRTCYGKCIPWSVAGFLIFLAAPFMRTQGRKSQWIIALGIFALSADGLWLALKSIVTQQAAISLGQAAVWVAVPLGIAAWVMTGPRTDPEVVRERDPPLGVAVVLGILLVVLVAAAWALGVFS